MMRDISKYFGTTQRFTLTHSVHSNNIEMVASDAWAADQDAVVKVDKGPEDEEQAAHHGGSCSQ